MTRVLSTARKRLPGRLWARAADQESIDTMKADILELLLRSHAEGDESSFGRAALPLAAAESTAGHAFVGTCSNSFDVSGNLQARQGGQL